MVTLKTQMSCRRPNSNSPDEHPGLTPARDPQVPAPQQGCADVPLELSSQLPPETTFRFPKSAVRLHAYRKAVPSSVLLRIDDGEKEAYYHGHRNFFETARRCRS